MPRLFRYILKANDWISIQEELDFIDEYLQIEKFRFGQKLQWSYDVEPSLKTMLIPKLFIHPLIENSVKHAVEATSTTIRIHLLIRQKQSDVEIVVSDNGMGISQDVLDQILLSFQDDKPLGVFLRVMDWLIYTNGFICILEKPPPCLWSPAPIIRVHVSVSKSNSNAQLKRGRCHPAPSSFLILVPFLFYRHIRLDSGSAISRNPHTFHQVRALPPSEAHSSPL